MLPRRTAVALLAVGTLAVAGCGSDDDATTTSAAPTTTAASTGTTAATTTTPAAASDGAVSVAGTGYGFRLPKGWVDVKATNAAAAASVDRAYAEPTASATSFRENVVAIRAPLGAESTDGARALDRAVTAARRESRAAATSTPGSTATLSPTTSTTIGGDRARTWTVRRSGGGIRAIQRLVLVVHGGVGYSLTISVAQTDARDGDRLLARIRGSWRWS